MVLDGFMVAGLGWAWDHCTVSDESNSNSDHQSDILMPTKQYRTN